MRFCHRILPYLLIVGTVPSALGQPSPFEGAHAYVGFGTGLFTYHGPVDLLEPDSGSNFIHENDFAVSAWGSFPVLEDAIYLRLTLIAANFNTSRGRRLVGSGQNEFLTENLLLFEPTIVFPLPSLGYRHINPYVFGGFGGTIADFLGEQRNMVDVPGSGAPGPERSAFHIPLGIGIHVPISKAQAVYVEASWRFDFNYVAENEPDYDQHSTSLLSAGVRLCLNCERPMPELVFPDPEFTGDDPDEDEAPDFNGPKQCHLHHMAPVEFKEGSSTLSEKAKALLDENVQAMGLMPECCVMITGRAGGKDEASARLLAVERARTVRIYYVSKGISESRLSHQGEWESEKCRAKGDASGDACLLRNTAVTESASCITDSAENKGRRFRIRRLWNFLLIS